MVAMPSEAKLKWGLRGGLNIAQMTFDKSILSAKNQTGFFVGPTLKLDLPLGIDLDMSALYDQREAIVVCEDKETNIKNRSIAIPLNIRKGFGLGNNFSVFVFAGPQFAFGVGNNDVHAEVANAWDSWTLKGSDFSINVGVGAMMFKHLEFKANYNIVCGKTGDVSFGTVSEGILNSRARTNAWQIGLAYYFN